MPSGLQTAFLLHIDCRIHEIYILLIQFFPQQLHSLSEALEVYDFPFPQELDHVVHIRIIRKPKNIIVCHSGFLLWYDHLKPTNI